MSNLNISFMQLTIFSIAMKLKSKIFIIFSSGTSEEHVSLTDSKMNK